jgi:hypothetical protein
MWRRHLSGLELQQQGPLEKRLAKVLQEGYVYMVLVDR